jgi:hypothetical protein
MPADASDILAAVGSVLSGLFPDVPVKVSKRRATDGRNKECGWQEGFPSTCFVLSCLDPEELSRVSSFQAYSVGYPVVVEYIRPAHAEVAGRTSGATTVVEDPDVRDKRQAIRRALYKPKLPGTAVFDVQHRPRPVYEWVADARLKMLVSGEQFTYLVMESRPTP